MSEQVQQAQSFLDETVRDKPRDREMVQMRVVNTRVTPFAAEGGNLIPQGESTLWVYDDHVKTILALVEHDTAAIAAAKRATIVSVANDVRKDAEFQGSTDDVIKLIENGTNERINTVYKHIMDTTPKNWQAMFLQLNGRSVNPLDSAELVEGKSKLEPQTEREIRRQDVINKALSKKKG